MATMTRQAILEEFPDLFAEGTTAADAPKTDREALCVRLIDNLKSQLGLYAAYRGMAERQRTALINRHLADNLQVNGEIEKLLHNLAGLEEDRVGITSAILGSRKAGDASTPAHAPAKCEAIYPLVSHQNAARLKECRDALMGAMAALRQTLIVNQALIENGSKIIHTTIGILTSVAGRSKADSMGLYTAKGGVNYARVQIRNLVNRSV
ncbi:MAG: flagellar protein FlgN [Fibrobacteres bacterium]|nr:flagellar protein FlgN [Fibrobacterota bacterium]